MSDINLQRFVDINIAYHEQASVASTRDTVVYLETGSLDRTYDKYMQVEEDSDASAAFKAWAKVYFDNGGVKVHHVGGTINASLVKSLKDSEVVVCIPAYATAKTVATDLNTDVSIYGIKQKIIVTCTSSSDADSIKNLAVKYSTDVADCASIAAYLSRIDFYKNNSVEDYCYTEEVLTAMPNDDTVLGNVLNQNMNVDMTLAEKIVNIGGNLKDGHDLVNSYTLIVLQQMLTDRLVNLLISKIKGSKGLSEIQSTVASEMTKFLANGYLTTDKIWKDDTLTITYNNVNYSIIEKDEPLLLGYKFVTLPIQSLTEEDKLARKAPPMYLVVADSYGIRAVTINGEVI